MRNFCLIFIIFFRYCLILPAFALPPDAGSILQEQQAAPRIPERLPAPERQEERPVIKESSLKVKVKAFRFSGCEGVVAETELQGIVASALGEELDFASIEKLADRVTRHLRDRGLLLARAYLPTQDVTGGIIDIVIIGGRLEDRPRIEIRKPHRIGAELIDKVMNGAVVIGAPIRTKNVERGILLANELPGITARASIEKGETPGTSRIVTYVEEGNLFSGSISADNYGNRYTGQWRGTGVLSLNNPAGIGDQANLTITGAEGLVLGRAAYSLLMHPSGLRGGISYTGMHYKVGKELESLDSKGDAHILGAAFTYPLIRSRILSLYGNAGYDYKILTDFANSDTTHDKRIHVGTAGLALQCYDTFLGGGMTMLQAAGTTGQLDLSRVDDDRVADDLTARSSGSYNKANYTAARLQRLYDRLSLFMTIEGQVSTGNLDSSEKFVLGGPAGVRAYPVGEAPGDEGQLISAELRYDISLKWGEIQLAGFYDAGHIRLHKNLWENAVATATNQNDYRLQGAGVGINIGRAGRYALRAVYALTIGDNPGRSTDDKDADGKSHTGRVWLQGVVSF